MPRVESRKAAAPVASAASTAQKPPPEAPAAAGAPDAAAQLYSDSSTQARVEKRPADSKGLDLAQKEAAGGLARSRPASKGATKASGQRNAGAPAKTAAKARTPGQPPIREAWVKEKLEQFSGWVGKMGKITYAHEELVYRASSADFNAILQRLPADQLNQYVNTLFNYDTKYNVPKDGGLTKMKELARALAGAEPETARLLLKQLDTEAWGNLMEAYSQLGPDEQKGILRSFGNGSERLGAERLAAKGIYEMMAARFRGLADAGSKIAGSLKVTQKLADKLGFSLPAPISKFLGFYADALDKVPTLFAEKMLRLVRGESRIAADRLFYDAAEKAGFTNQNEVDRLLDTLKQIYR
jgi:hypothetical protein